MELKIGKMSSYELAQWMDISYATFCRHRERRMNILKQYCKFKEYRGGVEIEEIYTPIYKGEKNIYLAEKENLPRNPLELTVGKINYRELAQWFGYTNNDGLWDNPKEIRERRMRELSFCADFHQEGLYLYIDKVYIPRYNTSYKTIEKKFLKFWGVSFNKKTRLLNAELLDKKIDTCEKVSIDIWRTLRNQVDKETVLLYVERVKEKLYGNNHKNNKGELGSSRYVYLNKDCTAPLSARESRIVRECAELASKGLSLMMMQIEDDYQIGKINKEEKQKAMGKLNTSIVYEKFKEYCINRLGFMPEKRTQLIDKKEK